MRKAYKYGAYLTALIHSFYVPLSFILVLRPSGAGNAEMLNFGICTSGLVIGKFIHICPLTFLERWFRKQYNSRWMFKGTWVGYYGVLSLARIVKFIRTVRQVSD